ncbi:MAG TPA: 23S rRNA (adenine(2030)-N(6))-methyltransferase RlmJ [Xanthobacteraceae bacterium]|nr:23S rRNA (adenine(2030)-N(6))-methyltransferase RlmJ [Xanthobacteraceae bacterium]
MNYRHAYHAGNFAEVVKHAVLARVVAHLREKPAAFRILDTHAGAGLTDLAGPEANKTGEWRDGIGRVRAAALDDPVRALLAPYLDAVAACNPGARLVAYPGSPVLVRSWLRPQDRLLACELEPGAASALARRMRGDARVKVLAIDGWTALAAYLPPKERRGAVLIDPPFEQPGEFARLADGLVGAHRKWATGTYLAWYPIKDRRDCDAFGRRLARTGIPKMLRAELSVAPGPTTERLAGTGLIVINPPWTLEAELAVLLPALAGVLGRERPGTFRLDRLTTKK